jgi:mannose-6-phosphate isomerase-like protein (cupin superfamily)
MRSVSSPAATVALSLLAALCAVPAAQATDAAPSDVEVVVLADQPWYEAEDRAVARELVSPRNSSVEEMSIAEIRVPPGVTIRPHHHHMEEVYHLVEGEGVVMVDDARRRVRAGETVVIPPHAWHNIENNSDADLRMIVTCVPAWAPEHLTFDRDARPAEDAR